MKKKPRNYLEINMANIWIITLKDGIYNLVRNKKSKTKKNQ